VCFPPLRRNKHWNGGKRNNKKDSQNNPDVLCPDVVRHPTQRTMDAREGIFALFDDARRNVREDSGFDSYEGCENGQSVKEMITYKT
jgi:hypothetical protein